VWVRRARCQPFVRGCHEIRRRYLPAGDFVTKLGVLTRSDCRGLRLGNRYLSFIAMMVHEWRPAGNLPGRGHLTLSPSTCDLRRVSITLLTVTHRASFV
jgi:hypothetical protein